jgi:hypothetical protein
LGSTCRSAICVSVLCSSMSKRPSMSALKLKTAGADGVTGFSMS